MSKAMLVCSFLVMNILGIPAKTDAQVIEVAKIIQEGIKKVIRAVDLQIQRLQNETIWLQNAQKTLENTLSKLKLDEISGWVERQRDLYAHYFDELQRVRTIIAYYHKIKSITEKQMQIVQQYKKALQLFRQDDHFTDQDIGYMQKVYTGIFEESLKALDQLTDILHSFATTMTDAKRLQIINEVSDRMDQNYYDLVEFNTQNKMLSLQRAKNEQEIAATKALYGLK
jgi:hypothetical protein